MVSCALNLVFWEQEFVFAILRTRGGQSISPPECGDSVCSNCIAECYSFCMTRIMVTVPLLLFAVLGYDCANGCIVRVLGAIWCWL